ncbi:MAG: ABC transporter permease [Chlamydiota bacterium]
MEPKVRGRIRRIKALIIKEYYQILRDPSSILISIVLPAILLFLYGYGISLDMKHLRIGVVLEDSAPDAQSFVKALMDSEYFDVQIGRDRREFYKKMTAGSIKGMVIIPSYFSTFREEPYKVAPIQVITDGSEPNTASFVQNYIQGAFDNWRVQEKISSDWKEGAKVSIEPRFWYNESLESRNFLVPGSLAIIMTLIGTLLTALVVAREWERGTMEALMATPIRMIEFIIAKLSAYFLLGIGSFIVSVILSLIFFQTPLRSSMLLLCGVASVFLVTSLGLGLLISTLAKNQFVASQIAIIAAFLPAFILSGFIYEPSSMPKVIEGLSSLIPARYFVTCLQTLFLVGPVPKLLVKNVLVMFGIGLVFFAIIARKTVKRLD